MTSLLTTADRPGAVWHRAALVQSHPQDRVVGDAVPGGGVLPAVVRGSGRNVDLGHALVHGLVENFG